ncbi:MAG: hypothetical protein Ct9H300mP18_11090 [Candidatus Neomarinimicrobiota bacterium]|nr:MAG: hypothetical protein Ct9H300mP18_11090 [Candidatus Neomarinimicrobiota bacterium]
MGDTVEKDEIFLEIGTDKVDSEIPSPAAGILVEILAKPNDVIDVGKVIARINTEADAQSTDTITDNSDAIAESAETKEAPKPEIKKPSITPKKKIDNSKVVHFFTPVVMKIASENNISMNKLELVQGSGRSGRVTKKDILLYLENRKE